MDEKDWTYEDADAPTAVMPQADTPDLHDELIDAADEPTAAEHDVVTPEAAAPEAKEREYMVFETENSKLSPGDTLTYLGTYSGETKADARWAAVDDDDAPDGQGLSSRVGVEEGSTEGGAFLIAVSGRYVAVERTYEEVVRTRVRR